MQNLSGGFEIWLGNSLVFFYIFFGLERREIKIKIIVKYVFLVQKNERIQIGLLGFRFIVCNFIIMIFLVDFYLECLCFLNFLVMRNKLLLKNTCKFYF